MAWVCGSGVFATSAVWPCTAFLYFCTVMYCMYRMYCLQAFYIPFTDLPHWAATHPEYSPQQVGCTMGCSGML